VEAGPPQGPGGRGLPEAGGPEGPLGVLKDPEKKEDFIKEIEAFPEELTRIADGLHGLRHVETLWEAALGAAAVAAITGSAERGAWLLEDHYSGEEADGVYGLLEAAANLLKEEAQEDDKAHAGTHEPPDDPGEWTERRDLEGPTCLRTSEPWARSGQETRDEGSAEGFLEGLGDLFPAPGGGGGPGEGGAGGGLQKRGGVGEL
jgi:hypothetical protein